MLKTCSLEMTSKSFSMEAVVRGCHVYKDVLLGRNSVAKESQKSSASLCCGSGKVRSYGRPRSKEDIVCMFHVSPKFRKALFSWLKTHLQKTQKLCSSKIWSHTVYWELSSYFHTSVEYLNNCCLLYTSPSPRDRQKSRMPSSA